MSTNQFRAQVSALYRQNKHGDRATSSKRWVRVENRPMSFIFFLNEKDFISNKSNKTYLKFSNRYLCKIYLSRKTLPVGFRCET